MSKKKLRHPWLDAKDPANCVNGKGVWVPTPDEIELGCLLAKAKAYEADGKDERSHYRSPKETTPFARRETIDETQLCDCPYWGTEFKGES